MKLITLLSLSAFVFLSNSGNGQSFTLVNPTNYYVSSNASQISQGYATVHNGSGSAKDVMVARTVNSLAAGHTGYFCWDVCYSEATNVSVGWLTVQPNTDNSSFYCDIDPHGAAGVDTVCYRFYDANNTTDYVDICMYFDIATGISTAGVSSISPLSVASPNPANTMSGINYYTDVTKNPSLVIYDLLGSKVFETKLVQKQGAYILNVSEFKSGIYLYSLLENGKTVATKKLVVAHK